MAYTCLSFIKSDEILGTWSKKFHQNNPKASFCLTQVLLIFLTIWAFCFVEKQLWEVVFFAEKLQQSLEEKIGFNILRSCIFLNWSLCFPSFCFRVHVSTFDNILIKANQNPSYLEKYFSVEEERKASQFVLFSGSRGIKSLIYQPRNQRKKQFTWILSEAEEKTRLWFQQQTPS